MKRCWDCWKYFDIWHHVFWGYYRCTICDNREFDKRMKRMEKEKERAEDIYLAKERNNLLREQIRLFKKI